MPEEVKFTDDELKQIDNVQLEYIRIKDEFGGICLNKINLRSRIQELDEYEDYQKNILIIKKKKNQ